MWKRPFFLRGLVVYRSQYGVDVAGEKQSIDVLLVNIVTQATRKYPQRMLPVDQ